VTNTAPTPASLTDAIIAALKTVYDPEIPVNLFDLGLIYRIEQQDGGVIAIDMTLTTPNCPVAEEMPARVAIAVEGVDGVTRADVRLVWDPPWDRSMMSEDAALSLDFF
jgi:FeS assembly SUF system protein